MPCRLERTSSWPPEEVTILIGQQCPRFSFYIRGALDVRATSINEEMKAAVRSIAELTKNSLFPNWEPSLRRDNLTLAQPISSQAI